ncbi:ABC transporter ATP-binding protein [Roseibacterium sp. SDUM158017]|uniref:ABC transporter ATP-binding protein n=1 Tax=Roseicyclus salinarum TaxID=3036773 RepID=UPI002415753D|nr:ABC transporter ATP-binding protein [Roseibacterium sp. SDUM158017]MDG4647890.1 ABC transporter ATP-binding protein [Roseibacterium sp. SDUM158017]
MLEVDHIETFYGETQALFGASLTVGQGEVVALLGPNGAGKTTTIRSILGLSPPKGGRVRFEGQEITHLPTHRISRMGIGWVPDDRRVFPSLSGRRNLALGTRRTKYHRWSEAEMVEIFPALEHLMTRDCENMSGGELQMVAISRALLGSPGLVLFDEPSQGLAPKIVQDVMKTIRRLKTEGISCLIVEQHAFAALEVSDRVYVMDKGRIVHEGRAAELLDNPALRRRLVGM